VDPERGTEKKWRVDKGKLVLICGIAGGCLGFVASLVEGLMPDRLQNFVGGAVVGGGMGSLVVALNAAVAKGKLAWLRKKDAR